MKKEILGNVDNEVWSGFYNRLVKFNDMLEGDKNVRVKNIKKVIRLVNLYNMLLKVLALLLIGMSLFVY